MKRSGSDFQILQMYSYGGRCQTDLSEPLEWQCTAALSRAKAAPFGESGIAV